MCIRDSFSTTSQIAIDRAPVVTAANVALSSGLTNVAASSLFTASDPDGDAITTYAFKDTGNGHFVLNGVAQANNQEFDVTAAQLSLLTYQNGIGTDSLQIRVNDGTLWSAWQSFAVTGPTATVIQTDGSTALTEMGNTYYLYTSGSGPSLKYGAAVVTAGEFGAWTLIGAVQVSGGYDVAWHDPSSGVYTVWSTDSNGNYLSNIVGVVPGTSLALETIETTFHQDLNGDGTIGPPTVVIQTDGSTALTEIGNTYYLYSSAIFLLLMFLLLGYSWHPFWAVLCGIGSAIAFVVGVRMPNCHCFLKTATTTERLPSLGRKGAARKALAILRPIIEQAQAQQARTQ